jgi:ABC-type phosphate/phosphonate transport system substrate-binding protein
MSTPGYGDCNYNKFTPLLNSQPHGAFMLFLRITCCVVLIELLFQASTFGQAPPQKDPTFIVGVAIPLRLLEAKLKPKAADAQLDPLEDLIESDSGLPADLQVDSAPTLLKRLRSGDIRLAVMPGIEYAWYGRNNPSAVPLLTMGNQNESLHACLIMKAETTFSSIEELRTKTIAYPRRNEYFVYLFAHSLISRAGGNPLLYFESRLTPANTDAAIEAVLSDEAQAVFVSEKAWQVYQERKPQRAKKLKVVAKSPAFPPPVALYNPEVLNDAQATLLRTEMCQANKKPLARQTLNFYRIEGFASVSPEYDQLAEGILKEFPKPILALPMFKKNINKTAENEK